ncbi:orotidine 5'-phosphate decarboxylase / HUMPS family protein, partial [Mycoplasmopsis bovis]|uniref:orotidine 5'-phosphate decarboxylase / HUMPS family protein n=1 Tax=Mycoplasmopsis bovis TaxID=28903 RepID=UPI003D2E0B35
SWQFSSTDTGCKISTIFEKHFPKNFTCISNFSISNKEVQIELTSNFTWEQANSWSKAGVPQVVWHRSRDSQASGVKWGQKDIDAVKKLSNMGFKVTITGGVAL